MYRERTQNMNLLVAEGKRVSAKDIIVRWTGQCGCFWEIHGPTSLTEKEAKKLLAWPKTD